MKDDYPEDDAVSELLNQVFLEDQKKRGDAKFKAQMKDARRGGTGRSKSAP